LEVAADWYKPVVLPQRHYTFIHCPSYWTFVPAVLLADIPSTHLAAPGLHVPSPL